MKKILQKELEREIATLTRVKPEIVGLVLNSFKEVVLTHLTGGNKVSLMSFGAFETIIRKERQGFNPKDRSQEVLIPATRVAKFKPSRNLKDKIKA